MEYFDIRKIIADSPNTHVFNIVGQGGVGKSYSTKKYVLENYLKRKEQFIYVRRWTTEIQNDNLETVFADLEEDPEVLQWWKDWNDEEKYKYFHILPKGGWFQIVAEDVKGEFHYLEKIGRPVALSKATTFKGGTYNNFTTVWFDEFITDDGYRHGEKEPNSLDKVVNTVGRAINEIRVILCGNPDHSIEMCPYLAPLSLDYSRIQPNTIYYYDGRDRVTGKILANNIMFIKLAGFSGGRYLNQYTSNVWQTAEGEMRETGEVKTGRYMRTDDDLEKSVLGSVGYEMVVETAVRTESSEDAFNRKIYVYVCYNEEDAPILIVKRHRSQMLREAADYSVFCRYDERKLRRHDCEAQILRLRVPDRPYFAPLRSALEDATAGRMIYTDDDQIATIFESIRDMDR